MLKKEPVGETYLVRSKVDLNRGVSSDNEQWSPPIGVDHLMSIPYWSIDDPATIDIETINKEYYPFLSWVANILTGPTRLPQISRLFMLLQLYNMLERRHDLVKLKLTANWPTAGKTPSDAQVELRLRLSSYTRKLDNTYVCVNELSDAFVFKNSHWLYTPQDLLINLLVNTCRQTLYKQFLLSIPPRLTYYVSTISQSKSLEDFACQHNTKSCELSPDWLSFFDHFLFSNKSADGSNSRVCLPRLDLAQRKGWLANTKEAVDQLLKRADEFDFVTPFLLWTYIEAQHARLITPPYLIGDSNFRQGATNSIELFRTNHFSPNRTAPFAGVAISGENYSRKPLDSYIDFVDRLDVIGDDQIEKFGRLLQRSPNKSCGGQFYSTIRNFEEGSVRNAFLALLGKRLQDLASAINEPTRINEHRAMAVSDAIEADTPAKEEEKPVDKTAAEETQSSESKDEKHSTIHYPINVVLATNYLKDQFMQDELLRHLYTKPENLVARDTLIVILNFLTMRKPGYSYRLEVTPMLCEGVSVKFLRVGIVEVGPGNSCRKIMWEITIAQEKRADSCVYRRLVELLMVSDVLA